jgi:4-hydroxy-tetrahydrodipicolinate reductase
VKIVLIGYGNMGRMIEQLLLAQGIEVGGIIGKNTSSEEKEQMLLQADVAIEFTRPDEAVTNISLCAKYQVPIVCGTTGWYEQLNEVCHEVIEQNSALLFASNFSLGVNLFFALNRQLAQLMEPFGEDYRATINETHHIRKKDAPSGTAISLAQDLIKNNPNYTEWKLSGDEPVGSGMLPIHAIRENDVPGTHVVNYTGPNDEIEIKHTAFNRAGFAAGAITAAKWLKGKKGIYTMNDVLQII